MILLHIGWTLMRSRRLFKIKYPSKRNYFGRVLRLYGESNPKHVGTYYYNHSLPYQAYKIPIHSHSYRHSRNHCFKHRQTLLSCYKIIDRHCSHNHLEVTRNSTTKPTRNQAKNDDNTIYLWTKIVNCSLSKKNIW